MYIFQAKFARFKLILEPKDREYLNRSRVRILPGRAVQFSGGKFTTSDEALAEEMRNSKAFGRDFFEIKAETLVHVEDKAKDMAASIIEAAKAKADKIIEEARKNARKAPDEPDRPDEPVESKKPARKKKGILDRISEGE